MSYIKLRFMWAVFIVLSLTILPLPIWLSGFRPAWALLFIIYVQCYMSPYFRISLIFIIGLCLDILLAAIIGQHVFALLCTTWLVSGLSRRFNFFPISQQMLLILLFTIIYQLILMLINAFLGYEYSILMMFSHAMISMLIWPWVKVLADSSLQPKVTYRV